MISPTPIKFVVRTGGAGFSGLACLAGSGAGWPAIESISIWRLVTGAGALGLRMAGVVPWATASIAAARGSSCAEMPVDSSEKLEKQRRMIVIVFIM